MPLTDTALRNAKPRDSAYKLSDRDGLYLLVSNSGNKLWRFDYRFLSKRKTLALGQYPITGLADARRACDEARTLLSRGIDPSEKRKLDKLAPVRAGGPSGSDGICDNVLYHILAKG